jgi:methionyl-tRNA synthetase
MKSFYITTTLPYVNAEPHIGFAMEIVTADVLARLHRLAGEEVVFNTGTDEHGQKIYQAALQEKQSPQQYVDGYAATFRELTGLLNLSVTHFVRTTDAHHIEAAQAFWLRCVKSGDIYKKTYKVKYCVGCELEKTESELVNGKCPLHPNQELELIEEENYFFRFSKYQQALTEWYEKYPDFVRPEAKLKEISAFVSHGLEDFSVSRLRSKMPWGIEVPGDPDQVMYVWFDALVNYISTLGWPEDTDNFKRFWPGVQIAGKDNLRQQAAMWQAMLLSAGLPMSKQILINGFISIGGQKMSKSLGNVIAPTEMVEKFGIDATRYLLIAVGPVGTDIDVTWDQFSTWYNGYLANSLGNTISRVANLCARSHFVKSESEAIAEMSKSVIEAFLDYRFNEGLMLIWEQIKILEKQIDETKPWNLTGEELDTFLDSAVETLNQVATDLLPIMPTTAQTILDIFSAQPVVPPKPLFPRIA